MAIVWNTNFAYRATVRGTYLGAQVINTYDFLCTEVASANASPSDFVTALKGEILDPILLIQHELYELDDVLVQNLGVPSQGTFLVTTPDTGAIQTETYAAGAAALCYTFRLTPNLGISRSGWKRYAGVPAPSVLGNDVIDVPSGLLANIANVATALASPFTTSAGNDFQLGVITHNFPDASNVYPVLSAAYVGLGTQNTRKPSRGT